MIRYTFWAGSIKGLMVEVTILAVSWAEAVELVKIQENIK